MNRSRPSGALTTKILLLRHGLQMIGADAQPIPAKMV